MNESIRIVLLEDDEVLATVLERAMMKRGHQLSVARNTADFISALECGIYDLIIMDLKLEHESSLASIAVARKAMPKAKIIMVTGYASIATTVEAIKQGADDYLPKPISADDILRVYYGQKDQVAVNDERLSPKRLEWEHIQRVLQENDGNISRTAEQLNMHRRTLQRKLQKKPEQER